MEWNGMERNRMGWDEHEHGHEHGHEDGHEDELNCGTSERMNE